MAQPHGGLFGYLQCKPNILIIGAGAKRKVIPFEPLNLPISRLPLVSPQDDRNTQYTGLAAVALSRCASLVIRRYQENED